MPLAGELTLKQDALVKAIVGGAKTLTEAGKRADYKHLSSASETLRLPKVQRAIAQAQARQGDRARAIVDEGCDILLETLRTTKDPRVAAAAVPVGVAVIRDLGEQEAPHDQQDAIWRAGGQATACILAGIRLAISCGLTSEALDIITERITPRAASWYQSRGYSERP